MLCAPSMWLRIHCQDHMETRSTGTLEISADEIDRRLIKGEEAHISSRGGARWRNCSRRDGGAVHRCRCYAGAGEHRRSRAFRRTGLHEHRQPDGHAGYADTFELVDGHADTDERTRLNRKAVHQASQNASGRPGPRPEPGAGRAGDAFSHVTLRMSSAGSPPICSIDGPGCAARWSRSAGSRPRAGCCRRRCGRAGRTPTGPPPRRTRSCAASPRPA